MGIPQLQHLAHLVLRVRDLERSVDFYQRVLGLEMTSRAGKRMAFLTTPGSAKSHELGLLGLGEELPAPDNNRVGLYHFAWELGSLSALEEFHQHLLDEGVTIVGYGDHGIGVGVYFLDPDGNELEVFYEVPHTEWPSGLGRFDGKFPYPFNVERIATA